MVRRRLNPVLRLGGVVLTMYDRRNNLSDLVAEDARGFFGEWVFETVIPRNVRLSEAPSHGVPVFDYDARSAGAVAYAELAAEMLRRDKSPTANAAAR
jgi:chromosome partitioning protein